MSDCEMLSSFPRNKFLFFVAAQGEPKYLEVGTTLTLEPDVSTVQKPIDSIMWKYGTDLVVDWDPSGHTYYGSFRGRTTLDPQTLRLVINRLTLADSRQFSLEANRETVGTHEVKVIKPPPTPSIKTQPLLCEFTCALKCTADTTDLGPVSYEWKKDEGEWNKGDALKNISSSDTPEKTVVKLVLYWTLDIRHIRKFYLALASMDEFVSNQLRCVNTRPTYVKQSLFL
ncbi:uncharacterized protein si:dkey-11f4.14 [Gadus chalcogrammus]|uniref:uncharacterized protein si:dkey-11f4.14 n=1 Tax=Gadus chalcogrammus TaxID=1042646 RepID=UPI0024C284F8|nr:uncharacterized protein si:dkey-11f4.14 [Gadus chalcogrammus]